MQLAHITPIAIKADAFTVRPVATALHVQRIAIKFTGQKRILYAPLW